MSTDVTIFNQISIRIIKQQALIIGPLAWDEARKVPGLVVVDQKNAQVEISTDDPKEIINKLVAQYERLFGKLSHEICREAAEDLVSNLDASEIPSSLK